MNIINEITCYFDGACEPVNPCGNMGIGAVILVNGIEIASHSAFVHAHEDNSNNVAEYMGLEWILKELKGRGLTQTRIKIFGDSKMVICQMKGEWAIKAGRYVETALRCSKLVKDFSNISFQWIPREENSYADELSKGELIKNKIQFRIQPVN